MIGKGVCRRRWPAVIAALGCTWVACGCSSEPASQPDSTPSAPGWTLTSPGLAQGSAIPQRYTCDGENRSPALTWTSPPAGTRSLVLVVDDPDAPSGTFTHWLVWGLSPTRTELPEGVGRQRTLADLDNAVQGTNGFGRIGYGGPCPPSGPAHRYRFTLYALDAPIRVEPGARRGALEKAMAGHVQAKTRLTATYKRAG